MNDFNKNLTAKKLLQAHIMEEFNEGDYQDKVAMCL